ncbi:DBH-like monooxygenase protein 2 homolog [Saccostrea echinata]|uniref:DBH-like monooxygenase protein 2 homolog n=1 Tax=Saccostrea echinata TaxID=191078 RepID=UPI002A82F362|nr:DBH-like monooxygenase protein 2 homolog [Saccostrea echinata]
MDLSDLSNIANPGKHSSFLVLLVANFADGYGTFRDKIPNGRKVPHPCDPTTIWGGVGHEAQGGGGQRNPFGLDFYREGKTWTPALCQMDSDGDGKTNGQELGDPDCEWTPNKVAKYIVGLSHPGVCEPLGDPKCTGKNAFLQCDDPPKFTCDMEEDTINQTLKFPRTTVPPWETNYYCMTFDLLTDGDYHLIGSQPLIDNADVLHHMILYGCKDTVFATTTPQSCGMKKQNCDDMIALWAVGFNGDCLHKDSGFRVGVNGYKKAILEIHWNNPDKRTDHMDGSGMYIFLTKTRRIHNTGILLVGQNYIRIPPRSPRVVVTANCSRTDTSRFIVNGPVYFTRALNHMHYLGREMKLEYYRDGKKLRDLSYETDYSYDSPKTFEFTTPIEFRPGDEIITTCVFSSMNMNRTVYKGDATNDEMCLGFLTYHPMENLTLTTCTQWQDISENSLNAYGDKVIIVNGCNTTAFIDDNHPATAAFIKAVFDNCKMLSGCIPECRAFLTEAMKNPCVNGSVGAYYRELAVEKRQQTRFSMFTALDSCNTEIARENCQANCLDTCKEDYKPTSEASTATSATLMASILFTIFLCL